MRSKPFQAAAHYGEFFRKELSQVEVCCGAAATVGRLGDFSDYQLLVFSGFAAQLGYSSLMTSDASGFVQLLFGGPLMRETDLQGWVKTAA